MNWPTAVALMFLLFILDMLVERYLDHREIMAGKRDPNKEEEKR